MKEKDEMVRLSSKGRGRTWCRHRRMERTGERQEKVEEIANGPIDSCLKGIDDDDDEE